MTQSPTAPSATPPGRRRLLARLNEPLNPADAGPAPTQTQAEDPVDPQASRIERAAARSAANYGRRLRAAEATQNPTALLMAHVDRIRALKNPDLTCAATADLADLITRHEGPGPARAA
jgi:hypothetical protein